VNQKAVHKARLSEHDETKQKLACWLSKTPEERVSAVDEPRRPYYGSLPGYGKVAKVVTRHKPGEE
jgi:hypothetical protein